MRPSFTEIFMELAHSVARRSSCARLQVGTVITTTDFRKVLAFGYNGSAAGHPNQCDTDQPGACGCIHSEMNAIINCDVARGTPKVVFVTHSPCVMCAKCLINLGNIDRLIYTTAYRDTYGLDLLERSCVRIHQVGGNDDT